MGKSSRFPAAFLVLLFSAASTAGASGGGAPVFDWRWSNPSPTGNTLIEVAFPDSSHGLAVSEQGEVAETRDGGWTWSLRPGRVDSGHLIAATVRRDGSILACAADGGLWKTSDGGATWRATAAAPGTLYDIRACGPQAALAVGTGGTIFRSGDGGETWTRMRRDTLGRELLGVHCGEGGLAFAVGRDGLVLRSRNQGVTWDSLPRPSADLLTRVAFADSSRGLATTGEGKVLATRDGGLTWKATDLDSMTFFRGIAWRDSDVTLTGSDGVIWKSRDDGATWATSDSPTPLFVSASAHVGAAGEVAVGYDGLILRSGDRGAHWESRRLGPSGDVNGLAVIAPDKWLAIGSRGMLLKSDDAGNTWKAKASGTANFLAGDFWGRHGAVCGYEGALRSTDDEGETWRDAAAPAFEGRLFGVAFADSVTVVAVGDAGTVWRSEDGGATWKALSGIPGLGSQTLSAVTFRPDGTGFIVGYSGVIFSSADRGATWAPVPSPVTRNLYGLAFRDDQTGIAVGSRGTVLRTRDGGATWAAGDSANEEYNIYGAAWLGGDTVLLHGERGHFVALRLSTDGGNAWTDIPVPSRLLLWSLQGLGSGKAALLGQNGAIVLGTLRDAGGKHVIPPDRLLPLAGFSVHRTGPRLRAVIVLPRAARFRITAHALDGRLLGLVYRGGGPVGRHVLTLPGGRSRGPALYRLETEDGDPPVRRAALLPY
jgi:photosystem II stability/assembly factor-like uncharacterized protein